MAMNIHREICGAVMGGGVSLESDQVHELCEIILIFTTDRECTPWVQLRGYICLKYHIQIKGSFKYSQTSTNFELLMLK